MVIKTPTTPQLFNTYEAHQIRELNLQFPHDNIPVAPKRHGGMNYFLQDKIAKTEEKIKFMCFYGKKK